MEWREVFGKENKPGFASISEYVDNPCWEELCTFIEDTYQVQPSIEYSVCSMAPGWNVKYKKSRRSLCTLYPNRKYFTCLLTIGRKEAPEAELILNACTDYLQELYEKTTVFNGARWLMIDVYTEDVLKDVLELLCVRAHPPKKRASQNS